MAKTVKLQAIVDFDEVDMVYRADLLVDGGDSDYGPETFDTFDAALAEAEHMADYMEAWHRDEEPETTVIIEDTDIRVSPERIAKNTEMYNVMTTTEAAAEFGVADATIRQTINRAAIPARQSGSTWLIHRADAETRWGTKHRNKKDADGE